MKDKSSIWEYNSYCFSNALCKSGISSSYLNWVAIQGGRIYYLNSQMKILMFRELKVTKKVRS